MENIGRAGDSESLPILHVRTDEPTSPRLSPVSSSVLSSSVCPRRRLTEFSASPSTPDLGNTFLPDVEPSGSKPVSPRLVRSKTLPGRTTSGTTNIPGLEGVSVDPNKIESLRKWILGIAIVTFDLELGPTLACVFPQLRLYDFEAENIAFSSFPDSPQFREGCSIHSFRIRVRPSPLSSRSSVLSDRPELRDGFMYGYSYFSQRKDLTSRRGYSQWSIVILSQHPFVALFSSVIASLGPLYHAHGEAILEVASHNIASWPTPVPGTTVELGFVGSVMHAELPRNVDEQQLSNTAHLHSQNDQNWHVLVCAPPVHPPPLHLFQASFTHLWSIWECLVLCEPILIFGSSPAVTSQAVWWLRDLFRPIPWAGDFRPYFTIHDKELNSLVNDKPPKPGLLLGVTNPFFSKSCSHWPHVLSLGKESGKGSVTFTAQVVGPPPGWTTKRHKRYISKDPQILQQMQDALGKHPEKLQETSLTLGRHLSSRTAAMLVPLNRYINTLIPSPTEKASRLRPFNNAHFFALLRTHGSPLPFKSSTKQRLFYERWLRTPAFGLWLARQEEIVGDVLMSRASSSLP
ncbi:hypothetical protein K488DRAFT_76661 [Vararia minispora EC-137]|uniref:Uncharacterized protein n=1 Tax=Vararia minispora EC-137 TaxID=1314806 RepID=A0ACB8QVQ7_9AGAM|nr:hypothetical protein K488DRAFT_76661 [Vararia minispora EC-137]